MEERKLALVTGGGKRLGREIALGLARAGYDLIIHYFQSEEGAEQTASEARAAGVEAELVEGDLRLPSTVERLADTVGQRPLDLLINSASIYPNPHALQADSSFLLESSQSWDEQLQVNAKAPFFLIQQLAESLSTAQGAVVNILDESISELFLSRACYTVSRFALLGVTQVAAATFEEYFRVFGLELGSILPGDDMSEEDRAKVNWLGPEPVITAILALAEEEGTGMIVEVKQQDG